MANNNNNKYVELLWHSKYDKINLGDKTPIDRHNLPFQVVETINKPRKSQAGLGDFEESLKHWPENYPKDWKNLLVWGDNKLVMSSLIKQGWAGKINLIYIDPPFFTGSDFTIRTTIGDEQIEKEPSVIEERAYKDTWSGGIASYINYMYERIILMRELLVENGSIIIHCDWHVGHYLKTILDEIFGYDNFNNEIIWYYANKLPTGGNILDRHHDMLLWYSKSKNHIYNEIRVESEYKGTQLQTKKVDGKRIPIIDTITGKQVRKMSSDKPICDVWRINMIHAQSSERIAYKTQKPEELLARIIQMLSNKGDLIADFFCGSGTTMATAEKLGRRWIGSDLSKFAIQIARKRFLDIHHSKDLLGEKKTTYDIPARPFGLWNIGNYETVYWQEKEQEYLTFMLKLYQARPLSGFKYLHGNKGDQAVHIGPLNAPVTMEEVEKVVFECKANKFKKADILGWEWSYEVNELGKELAKKSGVDLKLVQIPSVNEIKASLVGFDLQLLKVPDQIIEKELAEHVKFPEVAYLEIESKIKGKELELKIADFQLPPTAELASIAEKVSDTRDLIDYWAIDWDYKGDTFHNQWQSFRLKKKPKIDYTAKKRYEDKGEYLVMVKVVDVFGNDTNKVLKVELK